MAGKPGEVRLAVLASLQALAATQGHANCREIAAHSRCGMKATAKALQNMRTGAQPTVTVVGRAMRAGTRFWHNLYEPVEMHSAALVSADLARTMCAWAGSWRAEVTDKAGPGEASDSDDTE